MTKTLAIAALTSSVMALSSAHAAVQTVDFEGLARGTVVTNQVAGITVSATKKNKNKPKQAMIFDTNDVSGGDTDLQSDFRNIDTNKLVDMGKSLIISEDNDSSDPDDDAKGGKFIFDFANAVSFISLDVLDINKREGATIELFDSSDVGTQTLLATISNGTKTAGDREFFTLAAAGGAINGVLQMTVTFTSSGALDNLIYDDGNPVPVPGALPLMVSSLAGAAWMRRRRKVAG